MRARRAAGVPAAGIWLRACADTVQNASAEWLDVVRDAIATSRDRVALADTRDALKGVPYSRRDMDRRCDVDGRGDVDRGCHADDDRRLAGGRFDTDRR